MLYDLFIQEIEDVLNFNPEFRHQIFINLEEKRFMFFLKQKKGLCYYLLIFHIFNALIYRWYFLR